MPGRIIGQHLCGGRIGDPYAGGWMQPYNFRSYQVHGTRLLVHTGLPLTLPYTVLPSSTTNFSWDVLTRRIQASTRTLSSTKFAHYQLGADDVIIKEIWEPTAGASMPWSQLHDLLLVFNACPDWEAGEATVWRPMDRNCKAYSVDVLNIVIDGEDLVVDRLGDDPDLFATILCRYGDEGAPGSTQARDFAMGARVEVWLRLRPEDSPNASLFLSAGSVTDETSVFESD